MQELEEETQERLLLEWPLRLGTLETRTRPWENLGVVVPTIIVSPKGDLGKMDLESSLGVSTQITVEEVRVLHKENRHAFLRWN